MAVTQNTYTGNGSTVLFSFTFPYLDTTDIKVSLNGVNTILYTLANATTVQMNTAPALGAALRIYRDTDIDDTSATFFPGSSIRSEDLNRNFDQVLYASQETRTFAESTDASAIQATANTALANSNTAITTANAATATANGIAGTANTALSNSSAAVTTANAAQTTANTAQATANAAETTANAISATANTALSNAATAQSTANSATSAAAAAQSTANAALPKAGGTMTGNLVVPSVNGGPLAGLRNRIINGNFDIWQRGTSFTGSEYGADRWGSGRVGTTHTVTRQALTPGQTDVPNNPAYYIRTVVSSVAGASNYDHLFQLIESVRTLSGQQITVSFWAKADSTKNISAELTQFFGTGGSPSAVVNAIGVTKVSIGTAWQKVTVTANVPSISGKTLGTNGNDYLGLFIWFDAGSTFNSRTDTLGQQSGTFEIAQVQVEPGPVATPFEQRPPAQELHLCKRYLNKVTLGGGGYTISDGAYFSLEGIEDMRALPTFTQLASYAFAWYNGSVWTATAAGATFTIIAAGVSNRLLQVGGLTGNAAAATPTTAVLYGFLTAEL